MTRPLELWHIPGSPNNVIARVALGYKGLDYSAHEIDFSSGFPGDRAEVIRLSRQSRVPILKDGDTVIFDSGAIARYLEANFPDTPPLFSTDRTEHAEIEGWELFSRTRLGQPTGMVFGQAMAAAVDQTVLAEANALLAAATGELEAALDGREWLVGDHLTQADVVGAAFAGLALIPAEAEGPITAFFREHYRLGAGRDRTAAWVRRVLAHDRG